MSNHVLNPDKLGIKYEDIRIKSTDDIILHGWLLHAKNPPIATVLFFHGNAQNISTHIQHIYWLVDYGYDIVTIDYRGYGSSGGAPSIVGSIDDIKASIKQVASDERFASKPIFVIGQSLGGSLSIAALATSNIKTSIDALIVISSFSDYRRIAQDALSNSWLTWALQWPLSFAVDNTFSPEKLIDNISPSPILIMHGSNDDVVPLYHAKRLYIAASQPKFLEILPGSHNNFLDNINNRNILLKYLSGFNNAKLTSTMKFQP